MSFEITVEVDEDIASGVNCEALEAAAAAALRRLASGDAELAILVTSDEEVHRLNRDYRGVDAPTDVLSFAAQDGDDLIQGAPQELKALLQRSLGDVVIALPYAARQAARFGNTVEAELSLLTVHGILHLLGFDHATPDEEHEMWALQEEILSTVGVSGLSYRPHGGG